MSVKQAQTLADTFRAYLKASGEADRAYLGYMRGTVPDTTVQAKQRVQHEALEAHLAAIKDVSR